MWMARPSEQIINLWITQDIIKYDFSLDTAWFVCKESAIHFLNNRVYEKYLHMLVLYY